MKFIKKGAEPKLLKQWRLSNRATRQNLTYANVPPQAKAELREVLLKEQGFLCAYSMVRIRSIRMGHIEHIHPQSRPPQEASVDYSNMLYCHPGDGAPRCEFGAHKKDGTGLPAGDFVSPLDRTCERRFSFEKTGAIGAAQASDSAAINTIELLGLDASQLKQAREAAVFALPIFKGRRMSARDARKQAQLALQRDGDGMFREFAVAIHQVLARYAEARAAREAAMSKIGQR